MFGLLGDSDTIQQSIMFRDLMTLDRTASVTVAATVAALPQQQLYHIKEVQAGTVSTSDQQLWPLDNYKGSDTWQS